MGTITRKFANNFLSGGTFAAAAINNSSLTNITDVPTAVKGKLTLISTQTASASASISFTSGIDSTYDEYVFKYINIHPATDNADFTFNMSTDGGSNYNVTKTTTWFGPYHNEAGDTSALSYEASNDLAQSTGYQILAKDPEGTSADGSINGELFLYGPSSTTFVKHFMAKLNFMADTYSYGVYCAGYGNTTSAINAIDFKFASGNIDDGIIKLYGVSKT